MWDIAGRQGTVYELHGHRGRVTGVHYSGEKKALLTSGEDSHLVVWDMAIRRDQVSIRVQKDRQV